MFKYGEYWTAGFTAYQWMGLFRKWNVSEFDFINIGIEYDRVCGSLGFWFHLMGLRFWLCVSVREPSPILINALKEITEEKNGKEKIPQD